MLPINPAQIPVIYKQAMALQSKGRLPEARAKYQSILAAAPNIAEAHFQLGRIDQALGQTDAALENYAKAHAIKPKEPAILIEQVKLQSAVGQIDAALKTHDQIIALMPKSVKARADKAQMLQIAGRFDEAEVEFRKALKLNPMDGILYRLMVASKKIKKGDPLIAGMLKAHKDKRVQGRARTHLNFALAKAMEDTGQNNRVFTYLRPANDALRKSFPYDVTTRRAEVQSLIRAFEGHDFSQPAGTPPENFSPIFVTGLPRSGTTLAEQILASHSQVEGAGEGTHVLKYAYDLIGHTAKDFKKMSDIPVEGIERFGQIYHNWMRDLVSFDRYVTDKSTQSYLVMGLIKQAIPSARFIVVRRDPRDLLYSIYKNLFAEGTHLYGNDLKDLAAYYADYLTILDFWRDALPGGFHEVHYEALVSAPEENARALVAAAGLEWEDSCLEFHANDRVVRTLSVHQARQPIYRSSARAWEKFEKDLQPLTEALQAEGVDLNVAE